MTTKQLLLKVRKQGGLTVSNVKVKAVGLEKAIHVELWNIVSTADYYPIASQLCCGRAAKEIAANCEAYGVTIK